MHNFISKYNYIELSISLLTGRLLKHQPPLRPYFRSFILYLVKQNTGYAGSYQAFKETEYRSQGLRNLIKLNRLNNFHNICKKILQLKFGRSMVFLWTSK